VIFYLDFSLNKAYNNIYKLDLNSINTSGKDPMRRRVVSTLKKMDRYLIETPHTDHDCHMLVDQIYAMGYLYQFEWGCPDGVHCAWAIIEAESRAQALLAVPSLLRSKARVVKLCKFDGDASAIHQATVGIA